MSSVHAPADLQVGDLVVQRMWSPTAPRWSSTLDERIAQGYRYGEDRVMRVAGISEGRCRDDAWRQLTGFVGPLPAPTVRWWLVDSEKPRYESRMSWVESDWCELERVTDDGALW